MSPLRVVCISDTHQMHSELVMPEGDILVFAGDFSGQTLKHEVIEFNRWLGTLAYREIFMTVGNHDGQFKNYEALARDLMTNAVVLIDDFAVFDGWKIYGSPWTARFGRWDFMLNPAALFDVWAKIPDDTDILITHQPPLGLLDSVRGRPTGCPDLRDAVLQRVKPKLPDVLN